MRHRPLWYDSGARYPLIAAVVLLGCGPVRAQAVTEFPVPTVNAALAAITAGPDGALWFTETTGNKIGRIATNGTITEYPLPVANSRPMGITAGPDGALWFTEDGPPKIGRITTAGNIVEYPVTVDDPFFGGNLAAIVTGSDGALWFTETDFVEPGGPDTYVGRITIAGALSKFPVLGGGISAGELGGITSAPDGALWFTAGFERIGRITTSDASTLYDTGADVSVVGSIVTGSDGRLWFSGDPIGAITTAGAVSLYHADTGNMADSGIAAGPDGALWFTQPSADMIGRSGIDGTITQFPVPTAASQPFGIAVGSDGALWFTEAAGNKIGRIVPPASPSPLLAAVLPLTRSVQVGVPATVFTTIVNTSGNALANCFPSLPVTAPPGLTLDYRPTDPTTNMVTGSLDQSVTIGGNGSQSFVLGFTTNAPTTTFNQLLIFGCGGVTPVSPITGVNTVNLLFSPTPVPDVIALAATVDPGYVDIPSTTGAGEFAVATINLGIDATIAIAANTGAANLPVALTICQTNSSSGLCVAPPTTTVTTDIQPNATPTFGVFVTGSSAVADVPANNRVFVTFTDSSGVLRGETSVAVRTH
jgi:virginiamycin B lyase